MNKTEKKRIIFSFVIFTVLFLTVILKAFYVQVVSQKELLSYSKKQLLRSRKVYPNRANIYDRNGSPLAINIRTYSLFTIPKNIKNKNRTLKELSKIVPDLSYKFLTDKIRKRKRYTWIARKMPLKDEQVKKIKELDGIYIESVPKRIYPNGELAAQILGFVGVDNKGLEGIEYLHDEELRGKPKLLKYMKDAKGRAIKFESQNLDQEVRDFNLTIDKDLQAIAEKSLKDSVEKHGARRGGIGVMDTSTGEILAIANYPSFDPNKIKSSVAANRRLSFVTDPFEPGSTFKMITAASSLQAGISKTDTNYYCEKGRLEIQGHTIKEADTKKEHEWLSLREILKYSSNIGTTKIAFDLTYKKLRKSITDFGFGLKTGVELPGESRGIIPEGESVSLLSLSNISFGQGIATTGIQMLAAYGAIANDGIYIPPTIVKRKEKKEGYRVVDSDVAKELQDILVEAVDSGTGSKARIPYFKIAGKTSTAQRVDGTGGYKGYVSGFIGFPINVDKRFVVYAYVDDPKIGHYYGNIVAAPIFKKVAQYMLYKDKNFGKLAIEKSKINKRQMDSVDMKASAVVKRSFGKGSVPNFIGLDKKSSLRLAKKFGLKVEARGIGIVQKQSLDAGSTISSNQTIQLIYFPPQYD